MVSPGDIPRHLAACDVLVSPHLPLEDGSPFFFSPVKLFEYMAAGRAVVASRLGQIGEVLEDGVTGILHEAGDADRFREAVLGLAADPLLRARLGQAARSRAETDYTWIANAGRALAPSDLPPAR
jgi:glycosyltransferase involved in cell wall biosynthesis